MPTRWEYGSLLTIALARNDTEPSDSLAGILVTAMQARVICVVELAAMIPGERYACMNAVGEEGWIITGPPVRTELNRGHAITLDRVRLDPWIAQALAPTPAGNWARGYQEYPLRRPLD